MTQPPHPIPYQGSKRLLAARILAAAGPGPFARFFEPFAGSAAMTLAVAAAGRAERFVLGESLTPLAALWQHVLADPEGLAAAYEALWTAGDYEGARAEFNATADPARLLYLLARCVKASPRFNPRGAFNQSADRRRRGRHPRSMRADLLAASRLLAGRTEVRAADYAVTLADAGPGDLVYLDPPWQGTTTGRDKRYHQGLLRARLLETLADLDARGVPFLLSYDGRCGDREYGEALPESLGLIRLELAAGRSAQATLNGRAEVTVESLYVSRGPNARQTFPGLPVGDPR